MTAADMAPEDLPIFRSLSASKRKELLRNATSTASRRHRAFSSRGDVPNFQHIVLSGATQLFARSAEGREVLIEAVRTPDLIIPAAVVAGAPYFMQARVPEPSRFLLIPATKFREAVAADTRWRRPLSAAWRNNSAAWSGGSRM